MTKQTTEDVLFEFYRKEDTELSRDFFGEQEILIPHGTEGNQNGYAWRHSEFESEDLGTMYIAGIAGMDENSFSSSGLYDGFSTSTPGWGAVIIDAEKSDSKPKDYNMCWAATDSNLMLQAGWIPSFVENEDDIFNLYRDSFKYGDSRYGDFLLARHGF